MLRKADEYKIKSEQFYNILLNFNFINSENDLEKLIIEEGGISPHCLFVGEWIAY